MKRIYTIGACLLLAVQSLFAQDIITLKSGDDIKAKVTEISSTEIRYKRYENQEGPTIVIARDEVFAIRYENGTREVMGVVGQAGTNTLQSTGEASPGTGKKNQAAVTAAKGNHGGATIIFYRKNKAIPLILKTLTVTLNKSGEEIVFLKNAEYCTYSTNDLGTWDFSASVVKESKPVRLTLEAGKTYYISCQAKDDMVFRYGASIQVVDEQRALVEIQGLREVGY